MIFDHLMDSKALFLTANTSTLYILPHIDTKEAGPMVVEVPPVMLGAFNDAWFRYVAGVGLAGKDQGKGSDYGITYKDGDHQPFDGAKSYKLYIPANVPAADF